MKSSLTVVTISGHRQAASVDSADFISWRALADRLGCVLCIWAGPELKATYGSIHVLRRPRRTGWRSFIWAAGAVSSGVRLTREAKTKNETVILNGAEPWGWLSAWLVSILTRRPWLMDVHADYLALPAASVGRWRKAVLKRGVVFFGRRAAERRVVAQSTVDALQGYGVKSTLVPPRLLPIWEEQLERQRPPLSGTDLSLLAIGRLVPSKGYDLLLPALAIVREGIPMVRLRIVGDGPERATLERMSASLNLAGNIEFLGTCDVASIRQELARADMLVISSRDEGLPRTLLEGVAASVPVVATAVGGIPAATRGWPTVSLAHVDHRQIADQVIRMRAEPPTREELLTVRLEVLRSYGFAPNLDALAALYRTVSKSPKEGS